MIGFAGNTTSPGKSAKAYPIKPGTKASYFGSAYELGKTGLKTAGYYKDIEPYLPDKYIDKYTYKPHKRIAGYAGQTFHSKKKLRNASSNRFYEECSWERGWYNFNQHSRTCR